MYRGMSPSRQTQAGPHYLGQQDWPWPLLPPFLEPAVMAFSQDTLPLILHQAEHGRHPVRYIHYPAFLLGENFRVVKYFHAPAMPALLCHKEPAQRPLLGAFVVFRCFFMSSLGIFFLSKFHYGIKYKDSMLP